MSWITLVACLLVALLPTGGLAFCFGDDGHVGLGTLESLRAADAHPKTCLRPAELVETGDRLDDEHSPCVNLEIDASPLVFSHGGGLVLNSGDTANFPEFLLPSVDYSWRVHAMVAVGSVWVRPPGTRPNLALAERRTILLLI